MGHKVNPRSYRLQITKDWDAKWFTMSKRENAKLIKQDTEVRELIEKKFASRPTIESIKTERSVNALTATIYTAKAGVVIGKGGAGVQELKTALEKIVDVLENDTNEVILNDDFMQKALSPLKQMLELAK